MDSGQDVIGAKAVDPSLRDTIGEVIDSNNIHIWVDQSKPSFVRTSAGMQIPGVFSLSDRQSATCDDWPRYHVRYSSSGRYCLYLVTGDR